MSVRRVVFLGYGDLSPNRGGKSKAIFYITKGLYENGLLTKALVRDFERDAAYIVQGLNNVLIRAIPFGNLIPKSIGAIRKILKVNINNRYYSERLFSLYGKRWLVEHEDEYSLVLGTVRLSEAFEAVRVLGKTTVLYATGEHPTSFRQKYREEMKKWELAGISPAWSDKHFSKYEQSIKSSDYIIALSNESKKSYVEQGYDNNKIYVCPLGVDVGRNAETVLRSDRNKKDGFVVVFMGRVDVMKGVQYLLEAWKKANLPKDAILYVCGRHPRGAAEILSYFKDLENVRYPGFVNPREYFQKADVFVLPTLSEGFPKSVLEAMSYGLPGIVTPMASEPVVHGKNGFIVPYRDSDSIAYWLRRFYDEKQLLLQIGLAAKESARKYTWQEFSDNISLTLRHVMRARK